MLVVAIFISPVPMKFIVPLLLPFFFFNYLKNFNLKKNTDLYKSFYKVPKFLKPCLINPIFLLYTKKIAFCHLHLSDLTFFISDLPNLWMKLMLHSSFRPVGRLLLLQISSWVSTLPASSRGTKSACSPFPQRHFQRCPLFLNFSITSFNNRISKYAS